MRVLIINIFGIGDVLFTTPLISNLKAAYPDSYIGYLCNRRTSPLLERNPHIARIFVYERDQLNAVRQKSQLEYWGALGELVIDIRKERFDIVLDVSLNSFMGFIGWAAGIPKRIGFNYKGRGFFLNKQIFLAGYQDRHVVEYYLDLLAEISVPVSQQRMEFPLTVQDIQWAEQFVQENCAMGTGPIIGLVPGGGESWGKDARYKRWPAQCFSKLADKLIEKLEAQIILMGACLEANLCREVVHGMNYPCIDVCGKTSLSQFAALTKQCVLMVVNDGGPLHVAVAAGAKTVSIFGPVDEVVYGPYPIEGQKVLKKNIACQPCYRQFRRASCDHIRCLNELSVDEVFEKVAEFL